MALSFYNVTIPPIVASLRNLRGILAKGKAYADEQGMSDEDLLGLRLYEDMFDLRGQVGALNFLAVRGGALMVAGASASKLNPEPNSVAEIDANIALMLEDLAAIDADQYNQCENNEMVLDLPIGKYRFETARAMMEEWSIPNLYFHMTTAYGILRNNGVPLGKADYLGRISMRPVKDES